MKLYSKNLIKKSLITLSITIITTLLIGYIAFYFLIQTNLDYYKQKIVDYISNETNKEVSIKSLKADWKLTSPRFTINQLTIFNSNNTKTFSLNKVEV
ncbi:MAG: hypothetical protein AAEA78_03305, partial [Methylophilaceae bacterium]